MFQLTANESESLRSHFATLKRGRGQHRKYLPYVFTEQEAAMLSVEGRSDCIRTEHMVTLRLL